MSLCIELPRKQKHIFSTNVCLLYQEGKTQWKTREIMKFTLCRIHYKTTQPFWTHFGRFVFQITITHQTRYYNTLIVFFRNWIDQKDNLSCCNITLTVQHPASQTPLLDSSSLTAVGGGSECQCCHRRIES